MRRAWGLFLLVCLSCAKNSGPQIETAAPQPEAMALIVPGEAPLWFEFSPGGPRLIDAPGGASLTPFAPWPYARFSTGVLAWKGGLLVAVNREGFLYIQPQAHKERQGLALYRAFHPAWDTYTSGPPFLWNNTPGALLYRDDFFLDPAAEAPPSRAWGLDDDLRLTPLELPAFSGLPADWDIESLAWAADGLWYYHGVRRGERPEHRYFHTADLALRGTETTLAAFRSALRAQRPPVEPLAAGALLEAAFALYGRSHTVDLRSPLFNGGRHFALTDGAEGDLLMGFLAGEDGEALGLVLDRAGQGLYAKPGQGRAAGGTFSLPVLPEGFGYTHIGAAGTALVALWEEQQDLAIGAAGFVVLTPRAGP